MHNHGILPVGMPAPLSRGAQKQQQQQQAGGGSSAPDLLSSLKPCALPEDMPLPVSSRKAAAAAAAENEDDDDTGGFDWKGLARSSQQQRKQQHHRSNADAVATASQRIAVITGTGSSQEGAAGATSAAHQHASQKPESDRPGPQDGTDALGRKVWDKEFYEEKAKEKAASLGVDSFLDLLPKPREKPKPPPLPPCGYRQLLQRRTFKIDFAREVGRTKIVTLQTPRMQQGGFWCDICECLCKDSQAYLDHINGRNHNRLLGMSMRVERVSLARVKAALQAERLALEAGGEQLNPKITVDAPLKQHQPGGGGSQGAAGGIGSLPTGGAIEEGAPEAEDEFERVKRRLEELEREQELKKQRKKERKKAAAAGGGNTASATGGKPACSGLEANPDAAALAAMGLPTSFTGC